MMFCQTRSSSSNLAYKLSYYYLVSLFLSSWASAVQGSGSSGAAQIVGATGTTSSTTIPNPHHLLSTLRTGRDEEDDSHSATCSSSNTAPTVTSATGITQWMGASLFSVEQHESFAKDGFLIVQDLFPRQMLDELTSAGESFMANTQKMEAYFSSIEMGMIFQAGSGGTHGSAGGTNTNSNNNRTITKAFRNVAFDSVLPQAAAELMQLSPSQHVRVLRDVFMSKAVGKDSTCDWHVDDIGFWPESFGSGEQEGINVWIAMEDMPRQFQGSMALSPGSHRAEWRHEAYASIGLNLTFQGGFTKEQVTDMARSGEKLLTTCEMKTQAPEIREKIEATKWIPDVKKGDVIFATRSLFHRTVEVTEEGKEYYASKGIEYLNRYSIRYVPGSARLPHGWTFEWSIKSNSDNEGRTLDSAMEQNDNHLWYPRVWPTPDDDIHYRLDHLAETELADAKVQVKKEFHELISLFYPKKSNDRNS